MYLQYVYKYINLCMYVHNEKYPEKIIKLKFNNICDRSADWMKDVNNKLHTFVCTDYRVVN